MERFEIRQYLPEHMNLVRFDREALSFSLGKPPGEMAEIYGKKGPAFTAFVDGQAIGMAGVNLLWPGTGEAWAIFGSGYETHGIFIHRSVVKYLERIVRENKLIRLQAVAQADNRTNVAWLFHLGFKYEGEMPFYWQKKTFARFARIYEENF